MITLREMQEHISYRTTWLVGYSEMKGKTISLQEMRRYMGIEAPDTQGREAKKPLSLEDIRSRVSQGFTDDAQEIRDILKHTVLKTADRLAPLSKNQVGSILRDFQKDIGVSIPLSDIRLLDVMTMTDWITGHFSDNTILDRLKDDFLKLAAQDPWFKFFLSISVESVSRIQEFSNEAFKEALLQLHRFFGGKPSSGVTVESILKGSSPEWVHSLVHLLCSGYGYVDDRVAEKDFPFNSLMTCLWEEKNESNAAEMVRDIGEGNRFGLRII